MTIRLKGLKEKGLKKLMIEKEDEKLIQVMK
jgi:hypothetical protein